MTSTSELLAALSCPVADAETVQQMTLLSPGDIIRELQDWLIQVVALSQHLNISFDRPERDEEVDGLSASFSNADGSRASVDFQVVSVDSFRSIGDDDSALLGLIDGEPDVTVACLNISASDEAVMERARRLVELAGGTLPRALVMEPAWLAAAVVLKTKPIVYPGLQESDDSGSPYFGVESRGPSEPRVSRVASSTRRQLDAILFEPRSLPEKVRGIGARLEIPHSDVVTVTTFLPPVTHSRDALVRYYCSDGSSEDLVRQLIAARQDAESRNWEAHVAEHRNVLIVDRQQVEEYVAEPEYYQMALRPDELDEQVENFLAMLSHDNFRVALCPDAVDIPFTVAGDNVQLRGDRRNKSEPRPGRVNGLVLRDPRLAEELRREASSLAHLTEPNFKDKYFVGQWMVWLASVYRKSVARRAAYAVE